MNVRVITKCEHVQGLSLDDADRQRQTDRDTHRQTGRQTDEQTDPSPPHHTHAHTHTHVNTYQHACLYHFTLCHMYTNSTQHNTHTVDHQLL